jgi:Fusaric acid resistance protein-like
MEMTMASTSSQEGQHVPEEHGPSWLSQVFQLNPAGVNWARGVLIFDVILVPLVVIWAVGHAEYLLSAVFGIIFTAFADPGGDFGTRAWRNAVFALIGAGLAALGFGLGGAAWGWLAFAAGAVTLLAGLALTFGVHRFVAAYMLNVWFIIAIVLGWSFHHSAHVTSSTWGQVLAWAGGAALWIAVSFVVWLIGGLHDQPPLAAEIPGDTSHIPLTGPVIIYAVLRAVVVGGTFAIALGANLSHGYWMPIAALIAMKTSLEQSTVVGLQRLAGALIGAAGATLLMLIPANVHGLRLVAITLGLQAVAFVFFLHGAAIRFWNYAIYCAFIAAGVLTLIDLPQPTNYNAEGERVLWTLCGVAIAVVVMLLAGLLSKRQHRTPAKQPVPAVQTS